MRLLHNNEIHIDDWQNLLTTSSYSSPFQSWHFYQLCNNVPGLSADVFAIEDSGVLKSLCVAVKHKENGIKAFFSKRAIIYGGPIFINSSEDVINELLSHLTLELKRDVIYIEVRNYFNDEKLFLSYKKNGWQQIPYLDIHLSIKTNTIDEILAKMKYNRRREIKISISEGAIFREAIDSNEIESLYLILKELYDDKVKLPLPAIDFFHGIFKCPIGKVFIVLHDGKIIGGSFCFFLGERAIYTMYYCGARNYHKRIFPTHLSILAAIEFGIKNNLEYLDFMGAGVKGEKYGVRNYKQEFGGEIRETDRFRKINNRFLFQVGVSGLRIMSHFRK
jgi:serine/alanine adding enzyme